MRVYTSRMQVIHDVHVRAVAVSGEGTIFLSCSGCGADIAEVGAYEESVPWETLEQIVRAHRTVPSGR